MCLYVDWNQNADSLAVALSDGSLSVVPMREDRLEVSEQWTAHQYEVWTCYFDRARPHLLYSGSDDCSFGCWDLRESTSNAVFRNKKTHTMGVCCIAQNPLEGNMLLTGSYDEFLRVWDMRSVAEPASSRSRGKVFTQHCCLAFAQVISNANHGFFVLFSEEWLEQPGQLPQVAGS